MTRNSKTSSWRNNVWPKNSWVKKQNHLFIVSQLIFSSWNEMPIDYSKSRKWLSNHFHNQFQIKKCQRMAVLASSILIFLYMIINRISWGFSHAGETKQHIGEQTKTNILRWTHNDDGCWWQTNILLLQNSRCAIVVSLTVSSRISLFNLFSDKQLLKIHWINF